MKRTDEEILQCYSEVLKHLKDMLNEDIMVLITNKTHRLKYYPGKKMVVDLSKLGDELTDDTTMKKAIESGKARANVIDADVFEFPFLSIDYPIRNDAGEVIGCVGIGKSLEKEHKIEQISQALATTVEQINASLQEVAAGSLRLASKINEIVQSAKESTEKIARVNEVVSVITDISKHSNLLGLNAAIEAARVGKQGKGFSIVAEEMRKLAAQSKESAETVAGILREMVQSIKGIINAINQVGNIADNQAATTQEIAAAIQEVNNNSQVLAEFAKIQ